MKTGKGKSMDKQGKVGESKVVVNGVVTLKEGVNGKCIRNFLAIYWWCTEKQK